MSSAEEYTLFPFHWYPFHEEMAPTPPFSAFHYLTPSLCSLSADRQVGLKGITTTSWAAFAIDTQGKIAYTSTYKKGVLINQLKEELTIDLLEGNTYPEDLFLLCSDGLTDMLSDDQIQDILSTDIHIHRKAEELMDAANAAGGYDNITVVLAAIM